MGTTSKDAAFRITKNSTNAEIWTQVGYFSADTPRIVACGAAAECKNPLLSQIEIFVHLSTLDDFKRIDEAFYLKNFEKNLKVWILEKKTQKYV